MGKFNLDLEYAKAVVFNAISNAKDTKTGAITQSELSAKTGYSKREIRRVINALREEYPICSGDFGYKLTLKKADVLRTIYRLRSEHDAIEQTIENLNSFIERGIVE